MQSMQWARLIDIGLRVSVSQVGVWDLSHTAGCVISARPKPKYTKVRLKRAKRAKQREARKKQTGQKDTSLKNRKRLAHSNSSSIDRYW